VALLGIAVEPDVFTEEMLECLQSWVVPASTASKCVIQLNNNDMASGPAINAIGNIFGHQTAKYTCRVDDEITEPRMPARYKQLQELDQAGEDNEINRQQSTHLAEAQAEGESGCRKNRQMLKLMGSSGLWPQAGWHD
jgi:hypothetical protein